MSACLTGLAWSSGDLLQRDSGVPLPPDEEGCERDVSEGGGDIATQRGGPSLSTRDRPYANAGLSSGQRFVGIGLVTSPRPRWPSPYRKRGRSDHHLLDSQLTDATGAQATLGTSRINGGPPGQTFTLTLRRASDDWLYAESAVEMPVAEALATA